MKKFFSKKKHPRVERIFDVFFDPGQEALHLKRVKTDHEITDRSIWRKVYNRRRVFIPVGAVVVAVLVLTLALQGRANIAPFYATNCLGSWQGSFNATGEPETDSGKAFSRDNTARVDGSGELFCGGFVGSVPEGAEADQAFIKLALSQSLGERRDAEEAPTELVSEEGDESETPQEAVQQNGFDLLTVAYTLDGTTWIQAGAVKESDIFNGVATLQIDEVYWDDLASIQTRITALESAGQLYLDATWIEIAYASSLEDELAGLDEGGLEGLNALDGDELDILKSDKRIFRANEEVEFEFEIPVVLPDVPTTTPEEVVEEDLYEEEFSDEDPPPTEEATSTEEEGVPPDLELDEDTSTTSPQAWLDKARGFIGARLHLPSVLAQSTSTPGHVPIPRVIGFKLRDPRGRVVDVDPTITHAGNKFRITLPEQVEGMHPGRYIMEVVVAQGDVVIISNQEFFWGVLAVNLNKSVFKTGEESYIQMAALNNGGSTLCDADLELVVTDPKGSTATYRTSNNSITSSDTCGANNVTDSPDYFVYSVLSTGGTYALSLTNLDTGHSVDDTFEVSDVLPYSIERVGATRINPFEAEYEMQLLVETGEDFTGEISEIVPEAFEVTSYTGDRIEASGNSQRIVWDVDIKAEERHVLRYTYQAPLISPELFLLGPARVEDTNLVQDLFGSGEHGPLFEESRKWQLASDAVGDVNLGRWTGSVMTQGALPTTWTAPNGLFPTETRNDSSTYTFTSSNSTLTMPSTIEADGYLMIARFEYHDSSNGRHNPQCQIIQSGGTGNFVGPPAGGYSRNNNNDQAWVSCFAFVDNPSASATFQFQWKSDTDTATDGTQVSSFDVIPLYYAEHGLYTSTSASLYGGTTPNTVSGWTAVDESDTNAIQLGFGTQVTVKNDNKRYLVFSGQFYEGRGGRTQRWFGHEYDSTQDNAAKAYAYYRNAANDEVGNHIFDLIETDTANRTIEVTAYRGDGISNNQGGADADGSTPSVGDHGLVILELNDDAEVWRSHNNSTQDLDTGGIVDINLSPSATVDFNDAASFTRASDSAVNAEVDMDALFGANIGGASRDVSPNERFEARGSVTVNSTEDTYVMHGNYFRNNQGTIDTFGFSTNPVGFLALSSGDDVGASSNETGDGGPVTAQSGWTGFWGVNLDTLPPPTGNNAPTIDSVTLNGGNDIILTEGTSVIATTTITASDADGCDQLTGFGSVEARLYRDATTTASTNCSADDNNCYHEFVACAATTTGDTCGASPDTQGEFDCAFRLWYLADPTDSGTFAGDVWAVAATATDGTGDNGTATNNPQTIEVATLLALDVTVQGSDISYGSVDPNMDTGSTNQLATTTNTGNAAIDSEISGDIMCTDWPTCAGGVVQFDQQQFSTSTFTYGTGQILAATATPDTVELDLAKPTATTTAVEDELYWGIAVPNGTLPGSYEGQNLFTAVGD